METCFVSGANRGIGLGWVRYYLAQGTRVIAACRAPHQAMALQALAQHYPDTLCIETLDVTCDTQMAVLAAKYAQQAIDLVINNAGIYPEAHKEIGIVDVDIEGIVRVFQVNAVGTLRVTRALLPALVRSTRPIVVNLTSQMGSIAAVRSGRGYAYRMSKAALNMLTKCLACEMPNLIVVALRPGWVKTEMGGLQATLEVADSVAQMATFITQLNRQHSGRCFDVLGTEEAG